MNDAAALLGITAALSLGAASPGPSFIMVARTAIASGRAGGLAAALGMGLGGLLFAGVSLAGLAALLLAVPTLHLVLQLAGGTYLVWLGLKIWRHAHQPLAIPLTRPAEPARTWRRHFMTGFLTQLSNPKTAIVYSSVFAAFMPATPSNGFALAVMLLVFVVEAGWYALVALALSADVARRRYLGWKRWIDRAAGGVMVLLGVKLASSIVRP